MKAKTAFANLPESLEWKGCIRRSRRKLRSGCITVNSDIIRRMGYFRIGEDPTEARFLVSDTLTKRVIDVDQQQRKGDIFTPLHRPTRTETPNPRKSVQICTIDHVERPSAN
jgi:hypothetical protein